jgi:hypothetical protein
MTNLLLIVNPHPTGGGVDGGLIISIAERNAGRLGICRRLDLLTVIDLKQDPASI